LITPVFDSKTQEIIFFTASRGHHADIGGILPGSMPPTSVNIFEEGAEIVSFKIVDGGIFNREGLVEHMVDKPSQYPGSSGCRNIRDVESDLKAVRSFNYIVLFDNHLGLANCSQSQRSTTHPSECVSLLLLQNYIANVFLSSH
jgi:N-methylhydantoinase B/oxoprolinase/acetone carboxylase alpha subunit